MVTKKWVATLAAAALAGTLLSTTALAKEDNGKGALVALGDSITFGYNLENNNNHVSREAFPFEIGEEASLRVRDLGEPGWTTSQLLDALNNDEKFQQAVKHSDYVTLNIGSNDLLKSFADGNVTEEEISPLLKNLKDIITNVRTLTNAPIVVYNVYNPFQVTDGRHQISDLLLPKINYQIQLLVASLKDQTIVVADAYSAFGQNQELYVLPNDIHPTVEGQKKLAEIGLEALNLE